MTSPYRDQIYYCPACRETALRDLSGRLICDSCDGIFVSRDDLMDEMEDLGGVPIEASFVDDRPGARPCPRCTRTMTACRLRLTFAVKNRTLTLVAPLERCEPDGVWFDAGELGDVFLAVGRGTGSNVSAGALVSTKWKVD